MMVPLAAMILVARAKTRRVIVRKIVLPLNHLEKILLAILARLGVRVIGVPKEEKIVSVATLEMMAVLLAGLMQEVGVCGKVPLRMARVFAIQGLPDVIFQVPRRALDAIQVPVMFP